MFLRGSIGEQRTRLQVITNIPAEQSRVLKADGANGIESNLTFAAAHTYDAVV
jgi:hypothetical protein